MNSAKNNHIGRLKHGINLSEEFANSAKNDELAAHKLADLDLYKQACYFIIQAMEKMIRSRIFTLVNPNLEYFRNKNRHHSLESAIEFLLEIVSTDTVIKDQISNQLFNHVIGKTNYSHLHNNLRYPFYSERYNSYSTLEITKNDFIELSNRANILRSFLNDLHKLT
jgi:hypothetical protein